MGKRQHQKDKLYLTTTEWSTIYGGRRPDANAIEEQRLRNKRLKYDHCSLSFKPFEHPYCTTDGYVFDLTNIFPFLKKFGVDPITGKPMEAKSLIKLNYYKNKDGLYHCPVLIKDFQENSHIVAIKTTGNVYCFEAIEQLNIKAKNFRDLLSDEPFTKKDIITLQEPLSDKKLDVAEFHHVKNELNWIESDDKDEADSKNTLRNIDGIAKGALAELAKNEMKKVDMRLMTSGSSNVEPLPKPDIFNKASYSTGSVAASLTSTSANPATRIEAAVLDNDYVRYSRVKSKGYVQFQTNFGPLNFELYCDQTLKTCENFLKHCHSGYYNGTVFHRLIKNFMIQGGDPTGTGTGGESIWGKPFEDEFFPQLVHQGRGMLSMANSGKDTNKSQFFITFRSCRHLDKKHTIFGKMVGGSETLDKMERIKTDDKDRPLEEIHIIKTIVYTDPFKEVDDYFASERAKIEKEKTDSETKSNVKKNDNKKYREGVGSFIKTTLLNDLGPSTSESAKKKESKGSTRFGNFDSW